MATNVSMIKLLERMNQLITSLDGRLTVKETMHRIRLIKVLNKSLKDHIGAQKRQKGLDIGDRYVLDEKNYTVERTWVSKKGRIE